MACVAWLVVALQMLFGALELFAPRFVFDRVLSIYYETRASVVWEETAKIMRNMGLYNWFLALGLALALLGMNGVPADPAHQGELAIYLCVVRFFLGCVAAAGVFAIFSVGPSGAFFLQLVPAAIALVLSFV